MAIGNPESAVQQTSPTTPQRSVSGGVVFRCMSRATGFRHTLGQNAGHTKPLGSICQTWFGLFAVTKRPVDSACSVVCGGQTGFSRRIRPTVVLPRCKLARARICANILAGHEHIRRLGPWSDPSMSPGIDYSGQGSKPLWASGRYESAPPPALSAAIPAARVTGEGTIESADRLGCGRRPRQAKSPVQDPALTVLAAQQLIRFVAVGHSPGLAVVLQLLANSIGNQAQ